VVARGPERGTGTTAPSDSDAPHNRPARPLSAAPDLDATSMSAGE
jgi:hypothetical protein